MASRLAVYASSCGSPLHHARLAYDCSAQLYHMGLSPTGLLQRISTIEVLSVVFLLYRLAWRKEFIDGSIVRAHQHSTGAAAKGNQAIGKSVGGNTTKIHMAVDACGLPIQFDLTGGEVHDSKAALELIAHLPFADYTIADKGYDSEEIRDLIREKGSIPLIPRKKNSKTGNADMDWCLYKYRHLVENVFARLKHFRSIATRYDKLKRNYASMLAMACSYLWLPM